MTVSHLSVAFIPCFPAEAEYISIRLGLVCGCKGTAFSANVQYLEMVIFIFER